MTLDEIKKIELSILKEVHNFCVANEITYYLTFGTLLGAIRHGGFIPWDDDIDIFIPRHDYVKFINIFSSENCYCLCREKNKKYPFDFAKVCDKKTIKIEPTRFHKNGMFGIDIDVFPLDYYYDKELPKKVQKKWKFYRNLWNLSAVDFHFKSKIKRAIYFLAKPFLKPFTNVSIKKIDSILHKKSSASPVGYMTGFCVSEKLRIYDLTWFEKKELHGFEGETFYIPSGYDALLRSVYGDYMKLPPVEKRVSHHDYVIKMR